MKRLMMIAVAMAVLALGAVAVGGAVTSAQEGHGPIGTFLGKVADKLGVSEDELKDAIEDAKLEMVDEAVDEGRLTAEQAERFKEHAEERGFPFRGPLPGGIHLHGHGGVIDAAAEVLDMSQADLMEQLRDGNSLAEIAEAQMGQEFDLEAFKTALLDQVKAQLNEQADDVFQRIEENIDSIVTGEGCLGGFGGMRRGPGGFGGPGFGPFFDDGADSTETSGVTA